MPRPAQNLDKCLINLRAGDRDKIKKHFPQFYYTAVVRSLVEQFVDSLEAGNSPSIQFDPHQIEIK
jgi:hypothetical protein